MPLEGGASDQPPAGRRVVYAAEPPGRSWSPALVGAAAVGLVVAAWEAASRLGRASALFLPPPSSVVAEALRMSASGELAHHLAVSLLRVGAGFLLGAAAGTAAGLLLGTSRLAAAAGNPAMIALGVFFPVAINTHAGVRDADPLMVKAALSLGAGRGQLLRKVILPGALPVVLAGYRLGAGIALLLVVSAEMINATAGIGFLILNAGDLMLTGRLVVGLVLLALLGLGSTWGLAAIERRLAPWRADRT